MTFTKLSIDSLDNFVYGVCPHPMRLANGLVIGGGTVYPELNFTLPAMEISPATWPEVRAQYTQIITEACARAVDLAAPGLVVEFELLPELTQNPSWGAEITRLIHETLEETQLKHGLLTAFRVTPNDIREFARPPWMRQGEHTRAMFQSFELCAQAGADWLSIESTGGKEIHDEAVLNGDLPLSVFALGILGSRDMAFLWERIVEVCRENGGIPAGDSACGFANTAMALAEQKFIPRVWAAVIRVMSAPRSLVAFEKGAQGPSNDCAYEGPYIKAITGYPISLEGAEAACAHLSPIGNIAKAVPDLWSNESVNPVRLLGGLASTVSLEQLVYATRLMNTAAREGMKGRRTLRDWWAQSDAALDPQAAVLRPDVVLDLAGQIIAEPTPYLRTRRAALATLERLNRAKEERELVLSGLEARWLDRLRKAAEALPEDEDEFIARMLPRLDAGKIRLGEYGLAGLLD